MPKAKRFDVFLSHNHKDKLAARELAGALEARRIRVWLDEEELRPGQRWQDALEAAIGSIPAAAVLVGGSGLGPWQDLEMEAFVRRFVQQNAEGVIPVLLPGAPADVRLPLILEGFHRVDLRAGLTSEDLDSLIWGIRGKKPRAPRPPRAQPSPTAAPDLAIPQPAPAEAPGAGKPSPEPEGSWIEPETGIRFLWIPGGRFRMGGNVFPAERPIHPVRVSPFWLGETPVTNRQYGVFRARTGHGETEHWRDPRFAAAEQPVVGVSWEDARAFCRWLSQFTGRLVDLPSEAQWEFAARGPEGREYPWGDEPPDRSRACFGLGNKGQPSPVASYPAGRGPYGTQDQAGNVWEWCLDPWDEKAYEKRAGANTEVIDPVAEGEGDVRVLRGGGWFDPVELLRAACRGRFGVWNRSVYFGFRVAAASASTLQT